VAASIPPSLYAIVGVYEVIMSISRVFSNAGLETLAIRNVLLYQKNDELGKISELITQSLFLRILFACLLMIPLFFYAKFISVEKFNNEYFMLFVTMIFTSVFVAVNDSIILLLKSFNKYLSAAFVTFSINILGRFIAIFLFIYFGFDVYIYIIIFLPIIVTSVLIFKLREWISFKTHIKKRLIILNLRQSKNFTFSSYIASVYNMLDQLLVSIFFSTEVLGSVTLAKRILTISRVIVGNIFDPMVQKLVYVKDNLKILKNEIIAIDKIKNLIIIAMLFAFPLLVIYITDLLVLLKLIKYPHLDTFIIFIYVGILFLVQMKVKQHFILLFFHSVYNLRLSVIMAFSGSFVFLIAVSIDVRAVFLYLGVTNFIIYVYSMYIYKKKGLDGVI